jgi:hypothetical protein
MGDTKAMQPGKVRGKRLLTLDDLDGRTRAYKKAIRLKAGWGRDDEAPDDRQLLRVAPGVMCQG